MSSWVWLVGEQETKQWVQARLQTVPPTWNHKVSRLFSSTLGAAAAAVAFVSATLMADLQTRRRHGTFPSLYAPSLGLDGAPRYDRRTLRRFLIFALPLLVLTMALFSFALESLGMAP